MMNPVLKRLLDVAPRFDSTREEMEAILPKLQWLNRMDPVQFSEHFNEATEDSLMPLLLDIEEELDTLAAKIHTLRQRVITITTTRAVPVRGR